MKKLTIEYNDDATPVEIMQAVLVALGSGKSGGGSDAWRSETGFPKAKVINGARVMMQAPTNPEWQPSSQAISLSSAPNTFVHDPSNPKGARSPAGFPTYSGRVMFADESFANDAELAAWREAVAQQGNQAGIDAIEQAKLLPGAVDVTTLPLSELEIVLADIVHVLANHGTTHGPVRALHELSNLMTAAGITEDPARPGYIIAPPSFPQLGALTVARAKELAGM